MRQRAYAVGVCLLLAAATTALAIAIGLLQSSAPRDVWIETALAPPAAPVRLREGDPAPNFSLHTAEGDRRIELAEYRGRKPVALVFGSFT